MLNFRWLVFDLKCGSQRLATYECSEEETYLLLQAAIKEKEFEKQSQQVTLHDLMSIFIDRCKISQSEFLNKWMIALDTSSMTPFTENYKSKVAIESLEFTTLNEYTFNMLQAHILVDKETVLECNSPGSNRSRGSFDSFDEPQDSKNNTPKSSSFFAAGAQFVTDNKTPSPAKEQTKSVFNFHMRPPIVSVHRKISKG